MNWPWSKRRRVRCPDGSVWYVHANVDDAFPLQLSDRTTNIQTNLDAVQAVTAGAQTSYSRTIHGVLYALSEKNNSLMISFRGIYDVYQANPCANGMWYTRKVEQLVDEQSRLTDLALRLHTLALIAQDGQTHSDDLLTRLMDIVSALGAVPPALERDAAALAIEDNRAAAKEWIKPDAEPAA